MKSIKIRIAENGIVHDRCVMATVAGAWAVHRPWIEHPSTDDTWVVTHVRSGMAIANLYIKTKTAAVRVARAIDHAVGDCEIDTDSAIQIGAVVSTFRQALPGGEWRRRGDS